MKDSRLTVVCNRILKIVSLFRKGEDNYFELFDTNLILIEIVQIVLDR